MVKHTQTNRRLLSTNCLSVFDHIVGLALKELTDTLVYLLLAPLTHDSSVLRFI